ncbi:MAG: alpha-1,2-fucosyltransferase [Prosthecobacter sp.]|uniref:alpha-1,2-fucosyltransferase n=1 Tax=Prosthecobacter sp. TaxID=1965333 RepID=UPI001A05D61D|nr:alpha-1,2-fucosyltransferase [Prosthecobacter sp.]MBE2286410.1 alpha-1,2-fucosyltransferase [Prosthecobacter sp.]
MILFEVAGGLGNQMFEYATARRLAAQGDGVLLADVYFLGLYLQPQRRYRLDKFQVQCRVVPWHHVWRYSPLEFMTRVMRRQLPAAIFKRLLAGAARRGVKSACCFRFDSYQPDLPKPALKKRKVAAERHFHFDPEVLSLSGDCLLVGYWQSEKYFADIASQLRTELQVKTPQQGQDEQMAARIRRSQSVSLHVRRGDKATTKDFNGSSSEYCARAVAWFRERLSSPVFFVFTDDWDWVRRNLPEAPDMVHVSHNGDDQEYEDLRLMSQCQNHIIAPSSFSWWAAWLNPNPDKLVLAPPHHRWLNFRHCDTSDVYPKSWVQLDDQ